MATATKPENQVFIFDSSSTIGELLNVTKALTNAGQRPKLRLVKSYSGEFESVAVDVLQLSDEPSREMAVVGQEEEASDVAAVRITDDEKVWFDGHLTTWGTLSQNERMLCERNERGRLVGGYPL